MSQFLAVAKQTTIDKGVMGIIEKIAHDTADGRTLDIVRALYNTGSAGLEARTIAKATGQPAHKEVPFLEFLTKLKVLELHCPDTEGVPVRVARFRLTKSFTKLYREVESGRT
jgi:hypothetical protein